MKFIFITALRTTKFIVQQTNFPNLCGVKLRCHPICASVRLISLTSSNRGESGDAAKDASKFVSVPGNPQGKVRQEAVLNPAMEKKRQVILMEIDVLRQSDGIDLSVDDLRPKDWDELLELGSPTSRKRFFLYVVKRKIAAIKDKRRKERRTAERIERQKEMNEESAGHIRYGLGKNTMYFRVSDSAQTKFYDTKLAHAVLYGQKIVLDMDYGEHMRHQDIRSSVFQIQNGYGANKRNEDPFHLHFCNAQDSDPYLKMLRLAIAPLAKPKGLVTVTDKSYLDIFPKEKLVYLTPDCRNDLIEYDHDAVYIIGCFVDMANPLPISLAKAKRDGLKMARLPLERYVHFTRGGNKSLTIDQMINIMLTIKNTGDWAKAFKFVPQRKLKQRNYIERGPHRHRAESLFGHLTDRD